LSIIDLQKKHSIILEKYRAIFEKPYEEYNEKNNLYNGDDGYKYPESAYYTFNRIDFENESDLLFDIDLLENAIKNNKPISEKDMGFSDEEIKMMENGKLKI